MSDTERAPQCLYSERVVKMEEERVKVRQTEESRR